MGCGNSVENVKEMRPLEVPTKAMEPADISEGRNDKNLGNNIMTEMKTNDVSKSNEINTEETSQPVVSSSSVAIPLEKEKEKQKNDKKEKAAAGEIIQNNISAAFHQKKLSKAQIEKENEVINSSLNYVIFLYCLGKEIDGDVQILTP